jgi:hypothetical protein
MQLISILGCSSCVTKNEMMVTKLDQKLPIFNQEVRCDYNKTLLSEFNLLYEHENTTLIDNKFHWKIKFSDKYFDEEIKYVDTAYVVIYCGVSAIKNGYMIFPKEYNDLFLIDRSNGKIIVDIETKEGILNSCLKLGTLYFECYNPNVTRFYKFESIQTESKQSNVKKD